MMPFSTSGNPRLSPPRPVSMLSTASGSGSVNLVPGVIEDSSRMPPPPVPSGGRTMSMRSNISNSSSGSKGKSKKSDEPKKHKGLGKMLSLRSHNKPDSPEKKKGEESSSRLGRAMSMTFRSSKGGDSEKDKDKEKKSAESKGLLGRTMSLRTHKSSIGSSTKTNPAAVAAPNGLAKVGRLRPGSTYNSSTSSLPKLGVEPVSSATASVARRPTTGAVPVVPVKAHRRSASTVSTASVTPSSSSRPGTATKNNTTPPGANSKRPPFSSFNQEYPQPAPSGPSPRSRIIPPPPLDTQTIHQQTQLLQLLTLHSSSGQVYQELITSATTILKSRFEQLSARHYDVRETSIKRQNRANLDSLALVVNTGATVPTKRRQTIKSPEELVQAFSEGIKRTDALKTGEFRKLSTTFGEWISGYNSSATGREKWVDGIGENWRYDCDTVERKLQSAVKGIEGVRELFGMLGDDDAVKTTVQRVAEGYVLLAGGMLEEVEMMRKMECEVVMKERRTLRVRVENIMVGEVRTKEAGVWAR
ncbi:hypothetical protein L873DRAFT_1821046 [Choiromyces venosus 120613-1]|uniref:Uncharacterized protein n=1 Tax=Choiromyces venosus 120613-1 TaxID=1336337 RepID=A0A3N4J9G2_9PEZI|nr:hypothetical protein L873DRAFT_1821046 [Choiromyces venosus 120613-1]